MSYSEAHPIPLKFRALAAQAVRLPQPEASRGQRKGDIKWGGGSPRMQRDCRGARWEGGVERPGGTVGRPAHQLHAQAVLLTAVVAGNLLLDLLQCGRAPLLLRGFADILEQTQRRGWVYVVLRTLRGNTTPSQRPLTSRSEQQPHTVTTDGGAHLSVTVRC